MAPANREGLQPYAQRSRRSRMRVGVALLTVTLAVAGTICLGYGLSSDHREGGWTPASTGNPSPETAGGADSTKPEAEAHGARPVRLIAPAVGLDAPVVPVRLVDTILTPPQEAWKAGWWSARARPGSSRGPVVVVGHTVSQGGGVFDNLGDLKPGLPVQLTTPHGTVTYKVAQLRTMSRTAFARWAPAATERGGPARLVLISCGGWDGTRFRSNVVAVGHSTTPLPPHASGSRFRLAAAELGKR